MWIYLPEVKQKQGEALQYRFRGGVKEHLDEKAGDESVFDLKLSVHGSDEEVHLSGRFEAEIEASCSRCLRPFKEQISSDISEVFRVTVCGTRKAHLRSWPWKQQTSSPSAATTSISTNIFARSMFWARFITPCASPIAGDSVQAAGLI